MSGVAELEKNPLHFAIFIASLNSIYVHFWFKRTHSSGDRIGLMWMIMQVIICNLELKFVLVRAFRHILFYFFSFFLFFLYFEITSFVIFRAMAKENKLHL